MDAMVRAVKERIGGTDIMNSGRSVLPHAGFEAQNFIASVLDKFYKNTLTG
jgi:hypothetical protein